MAMLGSWERSWGKDVSLVPMRLALGSAMVYHGTSKLRGEGPHQTGQMFESLGLKPGKFWGVATGVAETFAGCAAILGVMTRPAALAVLVTQAVAVARVHAPKGYNVMNGGMEYNVALMAIAAGLLLAGPGRVSVHEAIERAAEGRGAKRFWRRARPTALGRAVKLIK
jgi:putative oxidoreductase